VRAFLAMTHANLRMTLRNRSALFFLMAFPIIFIVLFGYLAGGNGFSIRVGVAGGDLSPMTEAIIDQMEATEGFRVSRGEAESELAAIADGDRTVVVVFSPGEGETQVRAEIYFSQANPTVSQVGISAIEQFLLQAEVQMRGEPRLIETEIAGVDTDQVRFIDFFVPGIVAMSLMFNGIMSLSSAFVSWRQRGILRRIKGTPFPLWQFILSKITTQVIIALVQAVILIGLGVILFDVYISDSYVSLVVMIMLGALAFLSIGFLVSAFAPNSETADSAGSAITLPMMFLGGIFFPVDAAPGWLQPITAVLPLTHLANALREIMIDGATLLDVWPAVLIMLVTAAIGMAIAARYFRWESQAV
jgi:ABC-2 type transport system permease protein